MIRTNRRLAAATGRRQDEALTRSNAAGAAADAAVRRVWRALLAAVKARDPARVAALWRGLPATVNATLAPRLEQLAHWSHRAAVSALAAIPDSYLRRLPLREADTDDRVALFDLIFPPPDAATVDAVVYASGWPARVAASSRLAAPELLAATVAQGYAAGQSQRQIAQDLLPHVRQVQASARRVARTEGLRIAHEVQLRAHAGLGDLVIGYQVHATRDSRTRPAHAARDGTVYYRNPQPGQPGYDAMPRPPLEADGTVAHNCRCWLSPVLRDPDSAQAAAEPLPAGATRLAGGEVVRFTRHEISGRDEILVMVDPRKLDAAWSADSDYLPPGDEGPSEIRGRRSGFAEFLKKGKPVQASRVSLQNDGSVYFVDGRHRFAVLRDRGAARVGVMVKRSQAKKFRQRFG